MLRAKFLLLIFVLLFTFAGCNQGSISFKPDPKTEELLTAARAGHADTVRTLLSQPDAKINGRDENGNTALIEAARFGHDQVVQVLLTAGADPKLKNNEGKTAMMLAVQGGHDDVVRVLKTAGVTE